MICYPSHWCYVWQVDSVKNDFSLENSYHLEYSTKQVLAFAKSFVRINLCSHYNGTEMAEIIMYTVC